MHVRVVWRFARSMPVWVPMAFYYYTCTSRSALKPLGSFYQARFGFFRSRVRLGILFLSQQAWSQTLSVSVCLLFWANISSVSLSLLDGSVSTSRR